MKEQENKDNHHLSNAALMPREELLETGRKRKKITIGIPCNSDLAEKRVSLTPEAVNILVEGGNEVYIQEGSGLGANYSDKDYSENGAVITKTADEVLKCDLVIKVSPFTLEEVNKMKGRQVVMSYLKVLKHKEDVLRALIRKNITAIAFEKIKDQHGKSPVVESMSEINGISSILIASEYLSNQHGGKGVLIGGIAGVTPTEVLIIGGGTAGEFAARAAIGLGSVVKVFDNSLHTLRKFQESVGQRLQTSVYHTQVLKKALKSADVLIGAIEIEDLRPWYQITEDMIKYMKKGSVVIDLSIDRGGCIETIECRELEDPVFEKHGVIHFSAWNLPSRFARTASISFSNVFTPMIQEMADAGGIDKMMKTSQGLSQGVYVYKGILTNETLGQKFGILSKDINLLLAAF
ncbi:MAG: alanine dehydrogenase [Marinilabiliaceae bacterium]|jgi:alanine dehydrogenase|nr:alanine dehydrogenase [Marinilabiliaceae bacterium]